MGMKFCPQCNAQLDDDTKFCTTCGAPTADVPVYTDAQPEALKPHMKVTHSMVLRGKTGTIRYVESFHDINRLRQLSAVTY